VLKSRLLLRPDGSRLIHTFHWTRPKQNSRKVKPSKDAHRKLVALIRSQGLLQSLVIRPADGKAKRIIVADRSDPVEAIMIGPRGDDAGHGSSCLKQVPSLVQKPAACPAGQMHCRSRNNR